MLKLKKEKATTYPKSSTTIIAKGTTIKGDLQFQGNLDVSGTITGNIIATDEQSQLRVLPGGFIKGNIDAPFILVNGRIEGDIHALKHLEFSDKAKVNGSIHYTLIEIAKGAQVFGEFYQNSLLKDSIKPAEKLTEFQGSTQVKEPSEGSQINTKKSA